MWIYKWKSFAFNEVMIPRVSWQHIFTVQFKMVNYYFVLHDIVSLKAWTSWTKLVYETICGIFSVASVVLLRLNLNMVFFCGVCHVICLVAICSKVLLYSMLQRTLCFKDCLCSFSNSSLWSYYLPTALKTFESEMDHSSESLVKKLVVSL